MRIMIAGAGGLVGRELTKHLSSKHQVSAFKHDCLDITDRQLVKRITLRDRPSLIINCAVMGLDGCERDLSRGYNVNVIGTENLALAAAEVDAEFLHFSTNFVFDGKRDDESSYTMGDVPAPINLYGQTKLAGERRATFACPRTFIIRTSWVFGVGKKNFFSTVHGFLKSGQRIRASTDILANSTYVRDLVARVGEIIGHGRYSTYHVVNSGICCGYDFALEVARILDLTTTAKRKLIEPVSASKNGHSVKRPKYSPMRCLVSEEIGLAPMRDWRSSLTDYIHGEDLIDIPY